MKASDSGNVHDVNACIIDWDAPPSAADNPRQPSVMDVVRDQGRYDENWGATCVCHNCGKARQFLNQCVCGAP